MLGNSLIYEVRLLNNDEYHWISLEVNGNMRAYLSYLELLRIDK